MMYRGSSSERPTVAPPVMPMVAFYDVVSPGVPTLIALSLVEFVFFKKNNESKIKQRDVLERCRFFVSVCLST